MSNEAGGLRGSIGGHVFGAIVVSAISGVAESTIAVFQQKTTDYLGAATSLLVWLGALIAIAFFAISLLRYMDILDASALPADAPEREAYDRLRRNLSDGGVPARVHARLVARLLGLFDRLAGDGQSGRRTPVHDLLGLKSPAPLWTARAFERSLLLTFLYPAATIFLVWIASGHSGMAGQALDLPEQPAILGRSLLIAGFAFELVLLWRYRRSSEFGSVIWIALIGLLAGMLLFHTGNSILVVLIAVGAAAAITGAAAGTIAVAFVIAALVGCTVAFDWEMGMVNSLSHIVDAALSNTKSVALMAFLAMLFFAPLTAVLYAAARAYAGRQAAIFAVCAAIGLPFAALLSRGAVTPSIFVVACILMIDTFLFACAFAGVTARAIKFLSAAAITRNREGLFLLLYLVAAVVACFVIARVLSRYGSSLGKDNSFTGGPTLFLGLLPLLSAPFIWFSLGMTRALLRRGTELGGWWPYLLALADAILACVTVTALSIVLALGFQAFQELVAAGGVTPKFDIATVLRGIGRNPAAPESWWVYILLFSVMIPSVIDLAAAGVSLLRGIPAVAPILLSFMQQDKVVPKLERLWISVVLTAQLLFGAVCGIAVQILLVFGVMVWLMPAMRFSLLDLIGKIVALDLPHKVAALLA